MLINQQGITWQGKAETVTIHGKFVLFGRNAANTLRERLLLHPVVSGGSDNMFCGNLWHFFQFPLTNSETQRKGKECWYNKKMETKNLFMDAGSI